MLLFSTLIFLMLGGVLLLLPTKRGIPEDMTAPILIGSPFLRASKAVFCVPPNGAT